MLIKRTPAEWEQITKIKVIDPWGWLFPQGQLKPKVFHKQISRREFYRRAKVSSCKLN